VLVAVQPSVTGLYLPPVLSVFPLHTIISIPVHTAGLDRADGAFSVLVAVQLSVLGAYLPPVLKPLTLSPPPQTIISTPVHIAV